MKKLLKDIAVIGLVGGLALFVSGCDYTGDGKYTGGGWMASAAGDDTKATLGFNMKVNDDVKGQLQYSDKSEGVRFHGEVTGNLAGMFTGTYRPQPKGESGMFTAIAYDEGEPGDLMKMMHL